MYNFYAKKWMQQPGYVPKIVLIMKLTTLLLIVSILQVSASSFAQRVTLSKRNAALKEVLLQIKSQTGYDFIFNASTLKNANPVSIEVKNEELDLVLGEIFKNQPLEFKINLKSVVVTRREISVLDRMIKQLNSINVTGKVVDESNEPLIEASVTVKGSSKSTRTLQNGSFYLSNVAEDAILQISYIGFKTKEIAVKSIVAGQVIVMKQVNAQLEEVSVVSNGYQNISKERATGSYSKPNKEVFNSRSTSMNLIQRLDGLIPGLTINNAPNARESELPVARRSGIIIRGITSVNSSKAPLYVVDGLPIDDVNSINPNDVADITVLKDAMAASIWGSRASNGVIVITTKNGGNSSKIQITYDAFASFQGKPDLNYFSTMNSRDYIQASTELFETAAQPYVAVGNSTFSVMPPHLQILYNLLRGKISLQRRNAQLDSLANISNTQQIKDLFYRNALLSNHTMSVRAGGSKYRLYGSAAYTDTRNNTPGSTDNTYKINLRQDLNINKRISLYLITDLTNNETKRIRSIAPNNRFLPYQLFQDAAGKSIDMPWLYRPDSIRNVLETRSRISLNYNPLDNQNSGSTNVTDLMARINSGVTVSLLEGLKFQGVYGYIKGVNKSKSLDDFSGYMLRNELTTFTVASTTPGVAPIYYLPATGAKYTVQDLNASSWTVRNQLSYDKQWKENKHQLALLVGQEAQQQQSNNYRSTVRGYDPQLLTYTQLNYASLITTGIANPVQSLAVGGSTKLGPEVYAEGEQLIRLTSYYSNIGYTYLNRYTLNLSGRIDQSNLFGKDKSAQNKPVWSLGGKWQINNEDFMRNIDWLDNLAFRSTYGITGISPQPGSAASFDILNATSNALYQSGVGYGIMTPANTKLTWESTKTYNIGLDFGFLRNRVNGSVDAYVKNTSNLIAPLPVNSFNGFNTITGNLGDMRNQGFEIQLSSVNIKAKNFSWNTIFNFGYNTNKITKLTLNSPITTGDGLINLGYAEGYAAGAIFAYPFIGLDNVGDPLIRLSDGTVTKQRNVTKPEDMVYGGSYQPKASGGLLNMFNYKAFGLSANLIYNFGAAMRNDVNNLYDGGPFVPVAGSVTTGNIHSDFANRWKKPGDEAFTDIPAYVGNNEARRSGRVIDYYALGAGNILSADYIKMRDITLSYNLPKALLRRLLIQTLTLRCQLNNVMLWKANKEGIDPEFQYATGGADNSDTNGSYVPLAGGRSLPFNQHSVSFGINASF